MGAYIAVMMIITIWKYAMVVIRKHSWIRVYVSKIPQDHLTALVLAHAINAQEAISCT